MNHFLMSQKGELESITVSSTLSDTIQLLERHLKKPGDKPKEIRNSVDPAKELQTLQVMSSQVSNRTTSPSGTEVVRNREKVSFFLTVNGLVLSALMFGIAPEWVHIAYTIGALALIPHRWFIYKRKAWHYFLFDLCYYVNTICLIYIWFLPSSTALLIASYCLAHGSLALGVIVWRDSLVLHDANRVTTLFVHLYPPFTFTIIRHFYPNPYSRFPALANLPHLNGLQALLISGFAYFVWQALYYKFLLVDRREKIESGLRTTSFSWLMNDKRGPVGQYLSFFKPSQKKPAFLAGQSMYAMITELPAIYILYDSPFWSGVFLWTIFAISIWNGGHHIEVFNRKFEREVLRKELANALAVTNFSEPAGEKPSL